MPIARNGSTILLVEDDLDVRSYLETALRCQGYDVETAGDGDEALAYLQSARTSVAAVVMDVIMPRRDGIEALKEIRRFSPDLSVIMISGASSPVNVVEAMKSGATDFIPKPIAPDTLRGALKTACCGKPTGVRPADAATGPAQKEVFFGSSPRMQELHNLIGQIGWCEAPVLIQGETGVGKEVFARELHARSPRAKRSFLKLNCAALPSELVESELFGYERGAFTGAFQRKPGMFEQADGGTILLDEIGDMDFKLQAKLLQVLQDREFQRLGGKGCVSVDVRVIAATHRDLKRAIAEEKFREDLFFRLNVVSIQVPPLRERREDILAMAEFLVRKHTPAGAPPLCFPQSLQELFLAYDWPGNVRELENIVRKLLIFRDARLIERDLRINLLPKPAMQRSEPPAGGVRVSEFTVHPADGEGTWDGNGNSNGGSQGIPPLLEESTAKRDAQSTMPLACESIGLPVNGSTHPESRGHSNGEQGIPLLAQLAEANREAERSAILAALKTTNWNRRQAAALLQVDYKALLYKMKVLSIKKEKPSQSATSKRAVTCVGGYIAAFAFLFRFRDILGDALTSWI